jgi:hypothetical protein
MRAGPSSAVERAGRCDQMAVFAMGAAQDQKLVMFTSVVSG